MQANAVVSMRQRTGMIGKSLIAGNCLHGP